METATLKRNEAHNGGIDACTNSTRSKITARIRQRLRYIAYPPHVNDVHRYSIIATRWHNAVCQRLYTRDLQTDTCIRMWNCNNNDRGILKITSLNPLEYITRARNSSFRLPEIICKCRSRGLVRWKILLRFYACPDAYANLRGYDRAA